MLRFLNIFTIILIGLAATASYGLSEPFPASPAGTIFADEGTLNIELDAPLKELFEKNDANIKEEKVFVPGKLSYWSHQKQKITVNVRIRVKGHSTVTFCPFKKMEIKFKDTDTIATVFENMKAIDLNTHCAEVGGLDEDEQHFNTSFYNHREVAIYKMAEILRVPTYQVRALSIRYKNTGLKVDQTQQPYQAFFIEDHGDFLKRIQAREIKFNDLAANGPVDLRTHSEMAMDDLYRALLFNSLIRNRDWGFPNGIGGNQYFQNMKVIETQPGKWVPLIYDFNLSPIVTTDQSFPLDVNDILTLDNSSRMQVFTSFKEKRQQLFALLETLRNDRPAYDALKICLDGFFDRN